jgi:hypothetical protein
MTRCRTGWRSWRSPEKVLVIAPQLVEENSTRTLHPTPYTLHPTPYTQSCWHAVLYDYTTVLYTGSTIYTTKRGGGGGQGS